MRVDMFRSQPRSGVEGKTPAHSRLSGPVWWQTLAGTGPTSRCRGGQMDESAARQRLTAERADVAQLLKESESAGTLDRDSEDEPGDYADAAQPLTAQGMDDALAEGFRDRLAAIDRALKRLDDGTYGISVQSGAIIPDDRLDADPAAELTVEEARELS